MYDIVKTEGGFYGEDYYLAVFFLLVFISAGGSFIFNFLFLRLSWRKEKIKNTLYINSSYWFFPVVLSFALFCFIAFILSDNDDIPLKGYYVLSGLTCLAIWILIDLIFSRWYYKRHLVKSSIDAIDEIGTI